MLLAGVQPRQDPWDNLREGGRERGGRGREREGERGRGGERELAMLYFLPWLLYPKLVHL